MIHGEDGKLRLKVEALDKNGIPIAHEQQEYDERTSHHTFFSNNAISPKASNQRNFDSIKPYK